MSTKVGAVDGSGPGTTIGAGRAVQRSQDAATGGAQSSQNSQGSGGSSVQITGAARQLASLEQAVRDLPAVNDTRVSQLSNAIQQGTYTVDAKHIANQLIQMEKALTQGSSGSDSDPELDAD